MFFDFVNFFITTLISFVAFGFSIHVLFHGTPFAASASFDDVDFRILGGDLAPLRDFPYMVSILRNGEYECGGSIIHPEFVLTAAHCIALGNDYTIRSGSDNWKKGGTLHNATLFMIHKNFMNPNIKNYDIALIKVYPPFTYDEDVQVVGLANRDELLPSRSRVVLTGWGSLAQSPVEMADELHSVVLYSISNEECDTYYPREITPQMLCAGYVAGGKDACFGDSGSPLVVQHGPGRVPVQVGLVSWGPYGSCASKEQPFGVYVNVSNLREWIDGYTGLARDDR